MEMNQIVFDVVVGVIILAVTIVVRYLVPYLKTQIEQSNYSAVLDIVDVAVHAVEQTIRESGQGKAKKAEVIKFVTKWLNENNLAISEEQLDKLIEAAVFTMNKEMK